MTTLKIESTPLGLARAAIDAATSEINDALSAWEEEWSATVGGRTRPIERYPYGDFNVELRPDSASLGFEAVFEFSEDPGPDADVFKRKLAAVFEKHGVATVTVLGVNIDSADVEAFKEPLPCRRCSEYIGAEHHWIDNVAVFNVGDPEYACKHCDATAFMCPGCDVPVKADGDRCVGCVSGERDAS